MKGKPTKAYNPTHLKKYAFPYQQLLSCKYLTDYLVAVRLFLNDFILGCFSLMLTSGCSVWHFLTSNIDATEFVLPMAGQCDKKLHRNYYIRNEDFGSRKVSPAFPYASLVFPGYTKTVPDPE